MKEARFDRNRGSICLERPDSAEEKGDSFAARVDIEEKLGVVGLARPGAMALQKPSQAGEEFSN
jgi:hypothetical protein